MVWSVGEHKEILRAKNPLKSAIVSVHHLPLHRLLVTTKDSSKVKAPPSLPMTRVRAGSRRGLGQRDLWIHMFCGQCMA